MSSSSATELRPGTLATESSRSRHESGLETLRNGHASVEVPTRSMRVPGCGVRLCVAGLTSSNKKLVETSATLLVASALLVVTIVRICVAGSAVVSRDAFPTCLGTLGTRSY